MARHEHRLDEEQLQTYVALMEVAGQLRFRLERQLRTESELSQIQYEILGQLHRAPQNQLRMTDLADGAALSRSGLTYQVNALADAGLVSRVASPDDDRSTMVELTPTGRAEFRRLLPGHVDIVRALLFDAVPEDDVAHLRDALNRIRAHIRALPPRSAERTRPPRTP